MSKTLLVHQNGLLAQFKTELAPLVELEDGSVVRHHIDHVRIREAGAGKAQDTSLVSCLV